MKHYAKKIAKKCKCGPGGARRVHKMGAGKHSKGRGAHKMGGGGHCMGRGLGKLMKAARKVSPRQALGAVRVAMSAAEKGASGPQKDFLKAARLITSKDSKKRRKGVDLAVGTALKQTKSSGSSSD